MRVLAAIGALLFAYLAVIPAALVGATIDPGCTSPCGYAAPVSAYLVVAFGASAVALLLSAVSLLAFAARPSRRTGELVGRSLRVSAAAVALLLFSELALSAPIAAAVIAIVSTAAGWLITRGRLRRAGTPRAPG